MTEQTIDNESWDHDHNLDLDECEHEHATVDILSGELSCYCGYHQYLAEMLEAYYRECEQTERDAKVAT